jgi:hypothetical protein
VTQKAARQAGDRAPAARGRKLLNEQMFTNLINLGFLQESIADADHLAAHASGQAAIN